ncbi:sigma-70 RNA polymerase sigma factor region 4 domain-containing protein [Mycobacterium avium]|jgi:hypothetical protein|uniref:sigma-70 family RNA polymerase sigma factor n=1 Tax=Mycobacterium avium TaxID=1764 RepID=UPI0007A05916|nr:sigma-70 family RNA polymerase sigma factor [Mycobacterium avium]
MDEDQSSGDEPTDSVPHWESVASVGQLPAVSSAADQSIGKTWVAGPMVKVDSFLAGSPAVHSVMDAMVPSASEALNMSRLIGADHVVRAEADARFKLADLWANQVGRIADELHAAPKLTDLWAGAARPVWEGLHVGPGLGAELAGEGSARAKEIIADLAGLGTDGPLARAMTPVWEGLQSPVSELAASFVPAGPQPSVLSGFTSGIAENTLAGANFGSFAGLDLGSPPRFVVDQLSNIAGPAGPALSGDQWPWSKGLGASVLEGVTSAMHRHVQGLAGWMETTHRAAMDELWRVPQESIAKVLQSFSTLADQGVAWGWRALGAALRAQRAVLRGDFKAIVRFLREWLGFKRTPHTLVDAASAVLLEEAAWLPAGLAGDDKVVPLIKKLTVREHRNFQLLSDTQLRGRSVDSLDRKVKISRDEAVRVPLVELVAAPPPPPSEDDISDPRLVWIIDRLTERERKILRMKAKEGRTWADAAVSCGATLKDGENLRRKVKRLGKAADAAVAVESARAVS